MPDRGRPSRVSASSPIPALHRPLQPIQQDRPQDPAIRQLRLKVLYTFDEDKTNCLARWPYPIGIRTAHLDESTEIGVIELKTCLQAIAAASPEIVAKLGQDYTVYAYDYSEYETPLVGQGMLSWILASASPTPGAPAHQSRTIVTGRVIRPQFGLFGAAAQEMLEVKLRLVPVPTSLQSEYIESMKKYREISTHLGHDFDPQVWSNFVQANPGLLQQSEHGSNLSPSNPMANQTNPSSFGLQNVQRLLGTNQSQPPPPSQHHPQLPRSNSISAHHDNLQQIPRMPSPASSVASTAILPKRRGRKPGPKGPRKGKKQSDTPAMESTDPGYGTGDDDAGDGNNKKRAKVTQAEWDGRQDLGRQSDSLRVMASTAASVRIHQPTAVRPPGSVQLSLENQPRAPTPVADPHHTQRRLRLPSTRSNLGGQSSIPDEATSPLTTSFPSITHHRPSPAPMSSPERSPAASSPLEMASSPPLYPAPSSAHSSPQLPAFPHHTFDNNDFANDDMSHLFENEDMGALDLPNLDPQYDAGQATMAEGSVTKTQSNANVGSNLLPQQSNAVSTAPEITRQRPLVRTASTSNLPAPASDPIYPTSLNRAQSWAGQGPPHPASETTLGLAGDVGPSRASITARRVGDHGGQSGVRRKAVIQSNLKETVAAGELPPFCDNCGAIETPAWRKAWTKIHSGTPEHVRTSDADHGIITWQTLQTDSKGIICLYRIIKKSLTPNDEGFTAMLLCNPCGIFLYSKRSLRPKEMWSKSSKGNEEKRKNSSSSSTKENKANSTRPFHPVNGTHSQPSSPKRTSIHLDHDAGDPKLPMVKRRRASNAENKSPHKGTLSALDGVEAVAALEKAIRSSPHKFHAGIRSSPRTLGDAGTGSSPRKSHGSQAMPIEVGDLTPQPTRRLLFPSPKQLEEKSGRSSASPCSKKRPLSRDKNAKKGKDHDDLIDMEINDFDAFFDNEAYGTLEGPPPKTPSSTSSLKQHKVVFRTPSRTPRQMNDPTTADFFSSAARALLRPIDQSPNNTHKGNKTPSKSLYVGSTINELSPFSAHLNNILSEPIEGGLAPEFDLAALPLLRDSPSTSTTLRMMDLDFATLGTANLDEQDLISTDVNVPSSPPVWFAGGHNGKSGSGSGNGGEGEDHLWGDYAGLGDSICSPEGKGVAQGI